MDTTRSVSSSTLGSIFASATHYLLSLKSQSASAGRVGKRLHPPMVPVASAVDHPPLDPAGLGLLREERADRLRRGNVAAGRVLGPERLAAAVGGEERPPRVVVDELRIDMVEAPEHGEAGPRRGPAQVAPDPPVPQVARRPPLLRDHFAPAPAFLPTLRRTTSSEHLLPLPLYGSGLRSMRIFAAVSPSRALSAPRSVISVCLSISAVMPRSEERRGGEECRTVAV